MKPVFRGTLLYLDLVRGNVHHTLLGNADDGVYNVDAQFSKVREL